MVPIRMRAPAASAARSSRSPSPTVGAIGFSEQHREARLDALQRLRHDGAGWAWRGSRHPADPLAISSSSDLYSGTPAFFAAASAEGAGSTIAVSAQVGTLLRDRDVRKTDEAGAGHRNAGFVHCWGIRREDGSVRIVVGARACWVRSATPSRPRVSPRPSSSPGGRAATIDEEIHHGARPPLDLGRRHRPPQAQCAPLRERSAPCTGIVPRRPTGRRA
jgi:hypothetical protein